MIIGHQKQWKFLKKSFKKDRVSHAYLFSGLEQVGKKSLALEFVKLINCESSGSKPCQECDSCRKIKKNNEPDFTFIQPEGNEIKISQIRDLIWKLSLKPYSSGCNFKVALIDDAHLMNQEAYSALLKTLEEPKGNTVLILVTSQKETLPKTLISRAQEIKFHPVASKKIEALLKEKNVNNAKEIASLSLGKPGLALELAKGKTLEKQKKRIKKINQLIKSPLVFRFQYSEKLSKDNSLKKVLDSWLFYFRNLLLKKIKGSSESELSLLRIKRILHSIQRIEFLISSTNVNKRLALDMLMLEL